MSKKKIWHVGAWSGNFGDSIIQDSIRNNLLELSDCSLEFHYLNCQQTEFTAELIDELNEDADLLIVGGGGLIFYRPQDNSKSGWQWNIDIDLINRIRVPLVIYGVGYNQFEYDTSDFLPITNQHLQKTVQKASLFSVRNNGTKIELVRRGCDGRKIDVIPDSGMFLEAKAVNIPKLDRDRVKIGINWTTDREDQTFPPPWEDNKMKFLEVFVEVLNSVVYERDAQIFYIGHMGGGFDAWIIDFLKANLKSSPVIIDEEFSDIYPPSSEKAGFLVDVYRQMDVVLGMRGHSNIVSFGQNTPMIGLGSHRKIRFFLEDIGRGKYFFDVRPDGDFYSFGKMKNVLYEVIDNIEQQKVDMDAIFGLQRERFDIFNRRVVQLLTACKNE